MNDFFGLLETAVLGLIVVAQVWVFLRNLAGIQLMENALPSPDRLAAGADGFVILKNGSSLQADLFGSINAYWAKNKNNPDFSAIRDMTERHCAAEDDEIGIALPMPLYLGLLGTIAGIVLGLLQMSLSDSGKMLEDDTIQGFLGGVTLAMTVSGVGLFLSVTSTHFFYKPAKKRLEKKKNKFYDFVQAKMLPDAAFLTQQTPVPLQDQAADMAVFNQNFGQNIKELERVVHRNYEALMAQAQVLDKLEHIDVAQFAKVNIEVFRQMQLGAGQFEKFGQYLTGLNGFIENTRRLSEQAGAFFDKLSAAENNIAKMAASVEDKLSQSTRLLDFLDSHFSELEKSRDLVQGILAQNRAEINGAFDLNANYWVQVVNENKLKMERAVTDMHIVVESGLSGLRLLTEQKIESMKDIIRKEDISLSQAIESYKGNLSNLTFLKSIDEKLDAYQLKQEDRNRKTEVALERLNLQVADAADFLKERSRRTLADKIKGAFVKPEDEEGI